MRYPNVTSLYFTTPLAFNDPNGGVPLGRSAQNFARSSNRFNRLGLSHWDPYVVRRDGCLELYYCNMVEWFWWDLSLILTTNWFPSVL